MWTRALLKQNAKIAFKRNYWPCVAVSAIAALLGVASGGAGFDLSSDGETEGVDMLFQNGFPDYLIYVLGATVLITAIVIIAVSILVTNTVRVGCSRYFVENRERKTDIGTLFWGFQGGRYTSNVYVMFMRDLYVFLYTLLLIIPGIIKSYQYTLVPYILAENPELEKDRVLKLSKEMMDGHKMECFVLELSFIGWSILNALTLGILGIFYVDPYIHATKAEFYCAVKAEAMQKGITNTYELPGVLASGTVEGV